LLVGREHGRTIPLADMGRLFNYLLLNARPVLAVKAATATIPNRNIFLKLLL
jgi:hypothetical protein